MTVYPLRVSWKEFIRTMFRFEVAVVSWKDFVSRSLSRRVKLCSGMSRVALRQISLCALACLASCALGHGSHAMRSGMSHSGIMLLQISMFEWNANTPPLMLISRCALRRVSFCAQACLISRNENSRVDPSSMPRSSWIALSY